MALQAAYKAKIDEAIKALHSRDFYAAYPEHPKAYAEDGPAKGAEAFKNLLNSAYAGLPAEGSVGFVGEETSPYTGEALGITYPAFTVDALIDNANSAWPAWRKASIDDRAEVLVNSLERIKEQFFLIAEATVHTTGQSWIMSFQASGPHSNDRAMEALAIGYQELNRFPKDVEWVKNMGKFDIKLQKQYKPVPKGISLAIGCSTFPVWNTVPGIYASLLTGNPVIVKPHPKGVLPIAIVVAEIQASLQAYGFPASVIQLAPDATGKLITKDLAEHREVKLIDYTGSSSFGDYVESLPGKTTFTEKAGVNSVILDSVNNLKDVLGNLAFSVSLYSGQMCTAPQNFFIPATGVKTAEGTATYEEVAEGFKQAVVGLATHPKMGAGTLGAIQSEATYKRAQDNAAANGQAFQKVENPDYASAKLAVPTIIEVDAADKAKFEQELFGPVVLLIKTKNTDESIKLAAEMASEHGAITCAAYTTDAATEAKITDAMEAAFAPVTFNLTGFIWVNQHAAFSDFHVTGGNPAGNASFSNPEYVNKRFVWVGHRKMA